MSAAWLLVSAIVIGAFALPLAMTWLAGIIVQRASDRWRLADDAPLVSFTSSQPSAAPLRAQV